MKLHLEGMGLVGSLIAWQLAAKGVDFTWHDTDAPFTAWHASTGCCYPAGREGSLERRCYNLWRAWVQDREVYPREALAEAPYWFDSVTKHPPHGLDEPVVATRGPLRRTVLPSVHLNAQALVRDTRAGFSSERREAAPEGAHTLVTHGFTQRASGYTWGWSRLVRLLHVPLGDEPACLYLRRNRFQFAYAYPRPGTDQWYAGSSMIRQGEPSMYDDDFVERKFRLWEELLHELTDGQLSVHWADNVIQQGWRPLCKEVDLSTEDTNGWLRYSLAKRRMTIRPMGSNGFRLFPALWNELERNLRQGGIL